MDEHINTQEYLNSVLAGSSIEEAALGNPERLFNRKDPNLAIKHEQPEHRLAIMLKARGVSNHEIAKTLKYTDSWVSQLMRQPWAQERLLSEMQTEGMDAVRSLIEGEATNNIFTIIDIRDNPGVKPQTRLDAARSLLEQFIGKATQKIESETTIHHANDIATVDRELDEIRREEQRLCGAAANVDTSELEPTTARSETCSRES